MARNRQEWLRAAAGLLEEEICLLACCLLLVCPENVVDSCSQNRLWCYLLAFKISWILNLQRLNAARPHPFQCGNVQVHESSGGTSSDQAGTKPVRIENVPNRKGSSPTQRGLPRVLSENWCTMAVLACARKQTGKSNTTSFARKLASNERRWP
jgi:hypothetical protein